MLHQEPPKRDPVPQHKGGARSLALRIDRAAADLNPVLLVLVIGLFILNVTLYMGIAASREPALWPAARPAAVHAAPAHPAPSAP
ncbi:MAG: hypothetical protein JO008_09545 [Alphaproteobacteria bacterium]|nr:hypothetical protein [Alphaproteobacteria bacterium]